MPRTRFENNSKSTLSVAVSSNSQAALTLQTGHGARFPYLAVPDFFMVTLDDGVNIEVCKCIDRAGDVLTVLRGQEGTIAQATFATGTKVEWRLTKEVVRNGYMFAGPNMIGLKPVISSASLELFGMPIPTQVGSWIGFALVDSVWKTTQPMLRAASVGSAQTPVSMRVPTPICNVGRGFRARFRFAPHMATNSSHFFVGLVNTTGIVNSVHPPSSLFSAIVVGWAEAASPGMSIFRNDASGNAVKLDLGSFFNASSFAAYEAEFSCVGSEARIDYSIRRLDISSIADASSFFTTDIPPNSLFLSPYWHGVSMVTSAIGFDVLGVMVDT